MLAMKPQAGISSPKCNGQAMKQMLLGGGCGMCHGYSPVDGIPMAPMMLIASSPRPPSVSATMGMKFTPMERQACRWVVSLRLTPTSRAFPGEKAAS